MGLVPGRSQYNWKNGISCKNPQCKSYGKPHPNCRCTSAGPQTGSSGGGGPAGPAKSITAMYAEGGNVEDSDAPTGNVCSGVHKTDCEYYAGDPELGKSILKNAILRHTSEDDLTDSMLGKSKPEQAMHGLVAHSGAAELLGDVNDSLFERSGKGNELEDLGNKKLSTRAGKLLNKLSLTSSDEAMSPDFLKEVIRPSVEKMIGKSNPHITDAVITAISRGEIDKLSAVIDHASKVSKGHKSIDDSIESLFGGGEIDQAPLEKHREKLKKFISDGGINAQIMNQTQAMNEQPVQMAHGGMINANAPQSPIEKAFPEQSMLLGSAKSSISNYLQQQQPQAAQKLPFDPDYKNAQKDKDYDKALDIANKPLSVLKHVQGGTLVPEYMQHLVGMYPDLYNHLGKKATERIMKAQLNNEPPSYRVRQGLSMFLGTPLDSTMTPQAMQSIQAMYAQKMGTPANTPPKSQKKNTSKLGEISKDHYTQEQASAARASQLD